MINFELHGLMDCAVDLAQHYATMLAERIDVEEAIERLIYRPTAVRNTADVVECMRMIDDLRVRIAELTGTTGRPERKLKPASARLWRKNWAALRSLGVRGPETAAVSSGDRSGRVASVLPTGVDRPKSFVRKYLALHSGDIEWHHETINGGDVRAKHRDSTVTLTRVGDARLFAGNRPGALTAYEKSLGIARTLATADPGDAVYQRDLGVTLTRIGDARLSLEDSTGALVAYEESLKIARTLGTADPGVAVWQRDLSVVLLTVGDARLATGDRTGALGAYEESLKIARTLAAADPGRAVCQRDVSVSLERLGDAKLALGLRAAALAAYNEGLWVARRLAGADSDNVGWQRDLIVSLYKVATAADASLARVTLREAVAMLDALAPDNTLRSQAVEQGLHRVVRGSLSNLS